MEEERSRSLSVEEAVTREGKESRGKSRRRIRWDEVPRTSIVDELRSDRISAKRI